MRYLISITACLTILICAVSVCAQSDVFIDECDKFEQNPSKQYINLQHTIDDFATYSTWRSCQDKTVLTMTANKACAIYHVDYAEKLYVELYSSGGTFATINNKQGTFQIGLNDMNEFSNAHRCRYQQAQDKIYLRKNGRAYSLQTSYLGMNFIEDDQIKDHDDPYYGVNAEVSSDGIHYRTIDLQFEKVLWQNRENDGNYFREFYYSSLPAGTSYIKLTLFGYNQLFGDFSSATHNYPFLSKVKILKAEPVSSSTPEDPSSSEPTNSEPSSDDEQKNSEPSDHKPKHPISNGAADKEDKQKSLVSERFTRKKSIAKKSITTEHNSDNLNNENKEPPILMKENKTPLSTPEQKQNITSSEVESEVLQPTNLNQCETEQESIHSLQSLYQEPTDQTSNIWKGLFICSLIILPIISIFLLTKPHKS